MPARIAFNQQQLQALCERWKIQRFEFFGSVLRDDFGPDSDVDILVTFTADAGWNAFEFVHLHDELVEFFGRPVDVLTRRAVEASKNPYRRKSILGEAEVIFGA